MVGTIKCSIWKIVKVNNNFIKQNTLKTYLLASKKTWHKFFNTTTKATIIKGLITFNFFITATNWEILTQRSSVNCPLKQPVLHTKAWLTDSSLRLRMKEGNSTASTCHLSPSWFSFKEKSRNVFRRLMNCINSIWQLKWRNFSVFSSFDSNHQPIRLQHHKFYAALFLSNVFGLFACVQFGVIHVIRTNILDFERKIV